MTRPALGICKRETEEANHATQSKEVYGFMLLSLPMHLIVDILGRLPIRTIFICKCVCNTFKNILSDPYFARIHLAKASSNDYSLVIQHTWNPSSIFLTSMLDLDETALHSKTGNLFKGEYHSWQTLTPPASIPKKSSRGNVATAYLVGSCNGLLCLQYVAHENTYFYVCNPILGEFTILPSLGEDDLQLGGFGFCSVTNQYKVIRFITYSHSRNLDILTLGIDDDWRKISDAPPCPIGDDKVDSSYKGNLHWIVNESICSFNLNTEQYSYISLPSCLGHTVRESTWCPLEIGTLDGLFCISYMWLGRFEVYVVEDYEVKESWIIKVSIDTRSLFGIYDEQLSTVRFLDNGVLLLTRDCFLVYCDTRKGTSLNILGEGKFNATVHTPSLMSLKDIVKMENVEEVDRKMLQIYSP